MRLSLLDHMHCPYCGSSFAVAARVEVEGERLRYGLLRCDCFEYPVVDGVLLLSLAKGYGGAEENLQPGAALQIAAMQYLRAGDVGGLKAWIGRHAPIIAALIDERYPSYLDFAVDYDLALQQASQSFLARSADFEVVGDVHTRRRLAGVLHASQHGAAVSTAHRFVAGLRNVRLRHHVRDRDAFEGEQLRRYYAQRFFCVRANATALTLRHLPTRGRVLSVCSGHGVFENLLQATGRTPTELTCMDGQIINLLVVRKIIGADASLVCHDVQFGWPFADGSFDGVFSSTCLPEIPTQRHFVSEAVRTTSPQGWTLFDSIWAADSGVKRVDPYRYYRYCQNFLDEIRGYVPMFRRCVPSGRQTGFDVSGTPRDYLGGPPWLFDAQRIDASLQAPRDLEVSALVIDPDRFGGYAQEPALDWLRAEHLALSPAFDVHAHPDRLELRRRPEYARPDSNFAPKGFGALPDRRTLAYVDLTTAAGLRDLYCDGIAVPLPLRFRRTQPRLCDYAGAAAHAPSRAGAETSPA